MTGIASSGCQESVDAAADTATSLAAERVVTAENIQAVHSANVVHSHTYIDICCCLVNLHISTLTVSPGSRWWYRYAGTLQRGCVGIGDVRLITLWWEFFKPPSIDAPVARG